RSLSRRSLPAPLPLSSRRVCASRAACSWWIQGAVIPRCARCVTRRGSAHSGKLPCRPSRGGRVSTCVRQSRRVSGAVRSARSSAARPARILCRLPAPTTGPAHVLHPRSGIGAGGWCTIVAMSTHTPTAAPRVLPEEIAALRTDLTAASYRSATIEQLPGPVAADALRREDPVPALRVLEGREEPAAVLLRLFTLGAQVPRSLVEGALPSLGVDGARRLGLLETVPADADGTVRALFDLAPYSASDDAGQIDWWIAS